MKKTVLIILTLSFSLLLNVSCSKQKTYEIVKRGNVSVFKNKNKPNNPSFNYTFREVGTIPFFDKEGAEERNFKSPTSICDDNEGNIYIAGSRIARVLKFSANFKFLKSFGGKGVGPGEFRGGPAALTYFNDKILASCWNTCAINTYTPNGDFLQQIPPKISAAFGGQKVFNNNIIMNVEERKFDDDEVLFTTSLDLIDPALDKITKNIYTHNTLSKQRAFPLSDMYVRFTPGKELLYVGEVSTDSYKIHGYDLNFEKVMEINKSYRATLNKDPDARVYGYGNNSLGGGFSRKSDTTWKNKKLYYKSINFMFTDDKDRLWVVSPHKNGDKKSGLYIDIFEKGIYLNTVHFPFYNEKDFSQVYPPLFLLKDKFLYIDRDSECIRVYSFSEVEEG